MIIIAVIIFIVCSNLLLYLSEKCVPEVSRVAFAVRGMPLLASSFEPPLQEPITHYRGRQK